MSFQFTNLNYFRSDGGQGIATLLMPLNPITNQPVITIPPSYQDYFHNDQRIAFFTNNDTQFRRLVIAHDDDSLAITPTVTVPIPPVNPTDVSELLKDFYIANSDKSNITYLGEGA